VSTQLRAGQRALGRVLAGGGHVAIASRSPVTPYGLGFHAELALLARAGIAPAQILQLATAEAARVLGLQADLGSIQKGRLADLLVIDGDPLADVTQLLQLETVVQNGQPHPLAELLRQPEIVEKVYTHAQGTPLNAVAGPFNDSGPRSGRRRARAR
jgi:imidazolonepropionase-like amidohydrolase